jgi:phosphoserine phosphatase
MRGEILFRPALRQRVALLAGLDEARLAPARDAIIYMPGARELVRTMRANGAYTALVSGGFATFTAHVRQVLGFEFDLANDLEIVDGRLTGRVAEPILGRDAKLEALLKLAAERGLGPEHALAVGDGFNDLPMIEAAGLGVAFRAKPAVAEAAKARIDFGGLTALLFLQGYREEEIVR